MELCEGPLCFKFFTTIQVPRKLCTTGPRPEDCELVFLSDLCPAMLQLSAHLHHRSPPLQSDPPHSAASTWPVRGSPSWLHDRKQHMRQGLPYCFSSFGVCEQKYLFLFACVKLSIYCSVFKARQQTYSGDFFVSLVSAPPNVETLTMQQNVESLGDNSTWMRQLIL